MPRYIAMLDEEDGKFGAIVPDCPGCTAMGDDLDEAITNITEALREWMADRVADGLAPPEPRGFSELRDAEVESWFLRPGTQMVLIPLLLDAGRMVRANISLDAGLLSDIDTAAKAHGLTRSAFLASAAREKIRSAG